MQPDQQQRIMGYFIEEAKDHLNTIEQGLLNLQSTIEDPEMINEVFRAAHSVKGGAAMLGLNGIQRVSHRLEDFFKVLKETPIRVDQKLENLFLKAFDALQELLGQLQGPFGLTEDATNQILANVEPTFEELEQHLNELAGTLAPLSEVAVVGGIDADMPFVASLDSAADQLFRSEVPLRLREMLQLFKQPETDPTVRQQLQEACRSLISLGEQYQLDTWCHLVETARRAIAHPDSQYRILAPLVIRDIKLAQELVLANRFAEITPCPQLQELAPVAIITPETTVQDEFADLLSDDLLTEDLATSDVFGETDPSLELSFDDLSADGADLGRGSDLTDDLDLDLRNGPEVGMAELNSLADLFEGEMPELGLTWQQEEILADPSEILSTEAELGDGDDSADFSDLLFAPQTTETTQSSGDDDLNDLFGDDLDEIPTQAEVVPAQASLPNAELDDFADLLDISDSSPSSHSADLDLNLNSNTTPDLFDLDNSDDSTDLGLDLLDISDSDSATESLFDSSSELELDGALGDLGELFDGLNEGDLSTSSPEASVPEIWGQQPDVEQQPDLANADDWDLSTPDLDLNDAIDDLDEGVSLSEFDFENLTAIDPIDAPEGGEALSQDISADSLISIDTDHSLDFSDSADASGWDASLLEDLNTESVLDDLDLSESSDELLNSLDLDLSESSFEDSNGAFNVTEPTNDELLSSLDLDLLESSDNSIDSLDLPESTSDELLNSLDLDLTESGNDNLFESVDLTESGHDSIVDDDLITGLELDTSSVDELNISSDPAIADDEESEIDTHAVFELGLLDETSNPAVPDPWDDASLESVGLAEDPLAEMGFTSLGTDDNSALDNLGLEELGFDNEGSSDQPFDTNPEIDLQDLFGSDNTELASNSFDFDIDAQPGSDMDFNAADLETPEAGESADLDDLFGTVIQEGFPLETEGEALSFEETDLESLTTEGATSDSNELLDLEDISSQQTNFGLDDADLEIGESIDPSTTNSLLSDDLLTNLNMDASSDSLADIAADQLLSDDLLVGLDDASTSNSLDDLNNLGDLDSLLNEPESSNLPGEETGFELAELESSEFEGFQFGELDTELASASELGGFDAELGEAAIEVDQTEFDNLTDGSSQVDSFNDLDDFLAPETSIQPADEFGDLENLLDNDSSSDFADLDGLLDDSPSEVAYFGADPLGDFDNQIDAPITTSDAEDFSDLESLLSEGEESDKPHIPISAFGSDSEFDDLNDLLKDAEERMGPSVKGGSGIAQSRRPGRVFNEQTMRVPVKHLDNLSNLVGELVVNRNSLEQDQERLRQSLDNLLYQVQQLSDVGQRMQDLYERSLLESSLLASRQGHRHSPLSVRSSDTTVVELDPSSNGMEYDPLEMDRFTGFHSLSQEMIELIVRVRESSSDIEFIVDETEQVTRMFRQVTTQLQEGLTRSRMVPFAQTADRLPRAVRDISMKVGKQAELVIEGRETLIDKMILEQLYDPMTHLVNNAITHGIESPSVRVAAGKPPSGRIFIRAFHQGNQTIISVSDDGAGIDVERVKTKAIEKGLLTPKEAQSISRLDVYDILFHPGFSTKDQADDFSGRGVGMDVVRTSLSEIRGVINTDSNPGKGTTFTIRLPLTLSISKALCCISDRARIAFPMDGVEDMLDVPKERIQTNAEGQPCIAWRDTILPVRPLADLLGYNRHLSRGNVYGGNQEDDMVSIVVLRSAGNFLALQVDQVMGEQEIVIKQLEGPVPKPVGVAGATVLGDGRIMPIADVLELIDLSMGRIRRDAGGSLWEQDGVAAVAEAPAAKTEPMVLIVDDSITVRELLSMTFNKVGYRVEQARDGQEAWEKLRSGLPCDIVFCDIEMPRMDGLELLSRIQKDTNLKHLPIAMLTSRGADRHRQMAATLGASGYFTKPYLEEALLDAAQRMLKGERLLTS